MQKAVIVRACYNDSGDWQEYGIDEINDLLKDGWKVISSTPMGGAAYGYGAAYGHAGSSDGDMRCHPDITYVYNHESRDWSIADHDIKYGYDMAFTSLVILEKKKLKVTALPLEKQDTVS